MSTRTVIDPTQVLAKNVSVRTLLDAWRLLMRQPGPRVIAVGLVLIVVARLSLGQWSWRDAVIVVNVAAISPFTEWLIHRFFLHLRPVQWRGRRIEMSSARRHRHHHQSPGLLREVLLKPIELTAFLPMILGTMAVIALPIHLIFGGPFGPIWLTATVVAYGLLGLYEWTHLLIHTQYVPKSAIYKSCYRSHRLHHFRNENYWLGVTTNLADRVLRTNPAKDEVPVSPTATTLAA